MFNISIIIPEVGVTILEASKSKTGGKDFSKVFNKPSKYDYSALTKQNAQKNYDKTSIANSVSLKNILPGAVTSQSNDFMSSKINLPLLSTSKTEGRNTNLISNTILNSRTLNHSIDTMIINNKLTTTLKSTLDILDLIPNYDESNYENNNIDIFKKRKTYLEQQKDIQKKKLKLRFGRYH